MKTLRFFLLIGAGFLCATAFAQIKKFEELKSETEKKLKDKGASCMFLRWFPPAKSRIGRLWVPVTAAKTR